jgi:hypothetical protein
MVVESSHFTYIYDFAAFFKYVVLYVVSAFHC